MAAKKSRLQHAHRAGHFGAAFSVPSAVLTMTHTFL